MHTLLLVCLVRKLPIYASNAFEDNLVVQPMLTIPPIPMYLREYLLLEIATSHEQLAYSDTQHR